jgi:multidrug resistance efflux pump
MIQQSVNQILSAINGYVDFKKKEKLDKENQAKDDKLYELKTNALQSKIDLNKAKLESQNAITATQQEKTRAEGLKNQGIQSKNDLLTAKTQMQQMKNNVYEQNTLDKQKRAMENVKNNFQATLFQRQQFMENMNRMKNGSVSAGKAYDKQINSAIDRVLGGTK